MSFLTRLFARSAHPQTSPDTGRGFNRTSVNLGGRSLAGVKVDNEAALSVSAFYRGVKLLADSVAKVPIKVFARDDDGRGREPAPSHPAYRLLRRQPNAWMNAWDMKWLMQRFLLLHGNGYLVIARNGRGEPAELLPLDPRPEVTFAVRRNGLPFVVTNFGRANQAIIPGRDVIHLKAFYDGLMGWGIVKHAANSLGLTIGAEQFGTVFFRNAATPRFVLEHPHKLTAEAALRLQGSFDDWHSGIENAHKVALLEEGMKAHALSLSAEDAQLLETRKLQTREMANWFGVPAHLLGDDSRTSFASLEAENQSFLDNALDPWLVLMEQEFASKLLTTDQYLRETHSVEFIRAALVRADIDSRGNFYSSMTDRGIMSRNEARRAENLPPVPGGDRFMVPANMVLLEEDGSIPSEEEDDDDQDGDRLDRDRVTAAARAAIDDAVGRMLRRLAAAAARAAKTPARYLERVGIEALREGHLEIVVEAFRPAATIASVATGRTVDPANVAERFLEEVAETLLTCAEVKPDQLAAQVEAWRTNGLTAIEAKSRGLLLEAQTKED